jgi:hypothetical protein
MKKKYNVIIVISFIIGCVGSYLGGYGYGYEANVREVVESKFDEIFDDEKEEVRLGASVGGLVAKENSDELTSLWIDKVNEMLDILNEYNKK